MINPEVPDEHEVAWQKLCGDFIEITDEMVTLRTEHALVVAELGGTTLDAVMASYDKLSEESDIEETPAESVEEMLQHLTEQESAQAVEYLGNDDMKVFSILVVGKLHGARLVLQDDGTKILRHQLVYTEYNRLKRLNFTGSEDEDKGSLMERVVAELENGVIEPEEVSLEEARAVVYALCVARRYVGKNMYGREPLPTDPV